MKLCHGRRASLWLTARQAWLLAFVRGWWCRAWQRQRAAAYAASHGGRSGETPVHVHAGQISVNTWHASVSHHPCVDGGNNYCDNVEEDAADDLEIWVHCQYRYIFLVRRSNRLAPAAGNNTGSADQRLRVCVCVCVCVRACVRACVYAWIFTVYVCICRCVRAAWRQWLLTTLALSQEGLGFRAYE